ncbi:MAG: P-II family nitrogen regulator [Bacilli bacterium]|nr:P-II family nitrogen regulator [Bacilli bacterium]MDD7180611.1 P-II family nitrogen regulator [Bacilli bacterium]
MTENNQKYELILAIVNKGSTDLVMNAANAAGGRGGTISVARGTGNPELAKFYGLAIQPEKEIVFIVVDKTIKDAVMKKIYVDAGIATQGQGIIISLPITDAVGLTPIDEDKEEN